MKLIFRRSIYALLIGIAAALVALVAYVASLPIQPGIAGTATVTRVYYAVGKYHGSRRISFVTPDGRTGSGGFVDRAMHCRVGDVVQVERIGLDLSLKDGACIKPRRE